MRGGKKQSVKNRECEDWCFVCKDGGDLILCEHRHCLKVYHSTCVDSYLTSGESWACDRHSCLQCHNPSKFYCYSCPNAVCAQCIEHAEFALVQGDKGLCSGCLDLVILVEEKDNLDTDKGKIDLTDRNTFECLFLEYWDIIKEEEGLNLDDVYTADAKMRKGQVLSGSFKSNKIRRPKKDIHSDSDLDDAEEFETIGKAKATKAVEFCGWGSKHLIQFLGSLGKDTTKMLSQYDVYSIISEYIRGNGLSDPKNRKKIICDEKLFTVFRRRCLNKNKIYNLLEAHLIEYLDQSDEDDNLITIENCPSNKSEKDLASRKKRRIDKTVQDVEAPTVKESCFASVVSENIKLVYLRRSLVEKLLDGQESFEKKVVGSFVRVKNDPRDCTHRNPHQLSRVTDIKKIATAGDNNGEIILKIFNVPTDVSISMLSDLDFCEEEISELREIVEKGLLPKLTVVELEQKAKSLHEDITKDWMEKELVRLQKRIDVANEKGWRRELYECLERLESLKKPCEQERLLKQTPKVIVEEIDESAVSA